MRTYRIAVLECDTPIDSVLEKSGTYGKIFEEFLHKGLKSFPTNIEVDLIVQATHVADLGDLPQIEDIDAILLTGSKHNAFSDEPWIQRLVNFVAYVHKSTDLPIVGICFGHQIIARALGGQVQRSPKGWEISVSQINLTPLGSEIFGKNSLSLHQMHRDVVLSLPPGALNFGESPGCDIQGLYIPGKVFTLQAHPEFNEFIMSSILRTRHQQLVFDDGLYASGISRAGHAHDGALVSVAVWKFLLASKN